jgi:hypothetical protein
MLTALGSGSGSRGGSSSSGSRPGSRPGGGGSGPGSPDDDPSDPDNGGDYGGGGAYYQPLSDGYLPALEQVQEAFGPLELSFNSTNSTDTTDKRPFVEKIVEVILSSPTCTPTSSEAGVSVPKSISQACTSKDVGCKHLPHAHYISISNLLSQTNSNPPRGSLCSMHRLRLHPPLLRLRNIFLLRTPRLATDLLRMLHPSHCSH